MFALAPIMFQMAVRRIEKDDPRQSRYCDKCGAYIPSNSDKCLACGVGRNERKADVYHAMPGNGDVLLIAETLHSGVIGRQTVPKYIPEQESPSKCVLDMNALASGRVMEVRFGDEKMVAGVWSERERFQRYESGKRMYDFHIVIKEL